MNNQLSIGTNISIAADLLRRGELVAIPTETVYGLAGNALDENAVLNIFKMKGRPSFDPLIVHIESLDQVHLYAEDIPDQALALMKQFWPGPLTVLLKKKNIIPDLVTSGLDTVAIRIPDHPLTLELLGNLDFPLAAPSANPFGYISPTTAQHVADQFEGKIPYILDGGECTVGIESTIVGFENGNCIIYRLGGMRISEIEKCTGNLNVNINSSSDPRAPGMLKSHYAPSRPLYFGELNKLVEEHKQKKVAVICLSLNNRIFQNDFRIIELSKTGNLDEAARKLFSAMRQLDHPDVDCILAEEMPNEGLGLAINDRLKRASVNR
jgi:L-threonylcarbamoyladenylate synthase